MNIKINALFRYGCKKLNFASKEFKFLKKVFDDKSIGLICYNNFKRIQAYKVFQTNPIKIIEEKNNNLMLYHGTSEKGVTGILKEGFRNSEYGCFGQGVYMTDCSEIAINYSFYAGMNSSTYFIFVNEVLESEKLQTFEVDFEDPKFTDTKLNNQFEKHTNESSPQSTKEDFIVDVKGRRYVIPYENIIYDEYIAEASVVIPRYLIVHKKMQNRKI